MQGVCLPPSLQPCDVVSIVTHPESSSVRWPCVLLYFYSSYLFPPFKSKRSHGDVETGLYNNLN